MMVSSVNAKRLKRLEDTHVASMTTATPRGLIASWTAIAICLVSLSWTWSRREKVSAMRASLERPRTSFLGIYAMVTYGGGG